MSHLNTVLSQYSLNNLASVLSNQKAKTASTKENEHPPPSSDFLSPFQWEGIEQLANQVPIFTGLVNHMKINGDFWRGFMASEEPYKYLENNRIEGMV